MTDARWLCPRCEQVYAEASILRAEDPFNRGDEITACPECRVAEGLLLACDVDGCSERHTTGWQTDDGYRFTCAKHAEGLTDLRKPA